jgi:hypothetical protein
MFKPHAAFLALGDGNCATDKPRMVQTQNCAETKSRTGKLQSKLQERTNQTRAQLALAWPSGELSCTKRCAAYARIPGSHGGRPCRTSLKELGFSKEEPGAMHASMWGSIQSSPHLDSTDHHRAGEQDRQGPEAQTSSTCRTTAAHRGKTAPAQTRCTVPTSPMTRHSWARQVASHERKGHPETQAARACRRRAWRSLVTAGQLLAHNTTHPRHPHKFCLPAIDHKRQNTVKRPKTPTPLPLAQPELWHVTQWI